MWSIDLPLQIRCDDRTKQVKHRPGWEPPLFTLNLNQYRNAHFRVLNPAKVNFEILARGLIQQQRIPRLDRVVLEYTLYPGTRQLCDVNNVCTIVDKFFSDSLVKAGILEDDDYNFIADTRFLFGQIDRENPRVTVVVRNPDLTPLVPSTEPAQERSEPMKVTTRATHIVDLTQDDLIAACRKFIETQGGMKVGADAEISFKLTGEGCQLTIEEGAKKKKTRLEPATAMTQVNQGLQHQQQETASAAKPQEAAQAPTGATTSATNDEATPEGSESSSEAPATSETPAATESSQPKEETAPATPPPAKGPSLFSKFTRPTNS